MTGKNKSSDFLKHVNEIIQERAKTYESPKENWWMIAVGWQLIIDSKKGNQLTPRDIAKMMIWLKICRDSKTPKRDNMVDICGFASLTEEL